jgi:hypothetical protein
MGESRVENPDRENRWGIKSRKSGQRKPMGELRVENPDTSNFPREHMCSLLLCFIIVFLCVVAHLICFL